MPRPTRKHRRLIALVASVACAAVAFHEASGNTFSTAGVLAWLVSLLLWCVAFWPGHRRHRTRTDWNRAAIVATAVVLAGIVALGVGFRFHRLTETPAEPTSDHAEKLLDVQDVLDGQRPIFFPRNTGREPAQFYVTAALIRTFDLPPDFDTLKVGTALVDSFAILGVFLLASEIAGTRAGLAAAGLYSVAKWPIAVARAGLRFPFAPLFAAFSLWALFRYLRTGSRRDALLCGLFLGLGLYGYSPFRAVIPLVPLALGVAFLLDRGWRDRWRDLVSGGLLILTTAGLVFLPLGHFMLEQPDLFWFRASSRVVGDVSAPETSALAALADNIGTFARNNLNAALAFHRQGDNTRVNFVHRDPFLDPVLGAAFSLGIGVALYMVVANRAAKYLILLLALPILMLPSTLAIAFPIENPSVNRASTVSPVVFAIAAAPLGLLLNRAAAFRPRGDLIAGALFVPLLALSGMHTYDRYFHDFDRQYRAFVPNSSEVAAAVEAAAADGVTRENAYLVSFPHWIDARNVGIALGDIRWAEDHVIPEGQPLPEAAERRSLLLILHQQDDRRVAEARRRSPHGTLRLNRSATPGKDFYTFVVPADTDPRH